MFFSQKPPDVFFRSMIYALTGATIKSTHIYLHFHPPSPAHPHKTQMSLKLVLSANFSIKLMANQWCLLSPPGFLCILVMHSSALGLFLGLIALQEVN